MSIARVKNNMYQSYISCTLLEINLNNLINILNRVDDKNAYIVSQYMPIVNRTIKKAKRNFDKMLELNTSELHILFSEINKKNYDINMQLNILSIELNGLSLMSTKLYILYKLANSMRLDMFINAKSLKAFIPKIYQFKNELQIFKIMINFNNEKLKVGARI